MDVMSALYETVSSNFDFTLVNTYWLLLEYCEGDAVILLQSWVNLVKI